MNVDKQKLLEQIAADIKSNNICPNLAKQARHLVMGDGNLDAKLVFIGEAPGQKEDEQGIPFVGAAGKFLNEMLATINMQRQDIYITNIVKYRPPNNRDPEPDEKKAFWPYLVRQLNVIKPEIVVTLGRHSMGYFLPSQKIGQIHGQPKRIKWPTASGVEKYLVILPLFHPAAALYNGSLRQTLIDDFNKIPKIIELIEQER